MSITEQRASDVRMREFNMSAIINSVSSSVASLVVVGRKGSPEIKHFTSWDKFRAEYGDPDPTISMTHYCARDFFREGNSMYACRAIGDNARWSAAMLYKAADGTLGIRPIPGGVEDPLDPDWTAGLTSGEEALGMFYPPEGPGGYGDARGAQITTNTTTTPANAAVVSSAGANAGSLVAGNYTYYVSAVGAAGETLATNALTVVIAGNVTDGVNTLTWDLSLNAYGYYIYGRTASGIGRIGQVGAAVGTFVDTGSLVPDTTQMPITNPANVPEASRFFTLQTFDTDLSTNPLETYTVTFGPGTDNTGTTTEIETRVNAFSLYLRYISNPLVAPGGHPLPTPVAMTHLEGGDSGTAPTSYDVMRSWSKFSNRDKYPINMMINGGIADPAVQKHMDEIAVRRGDCTPYLDTPSTMQRYDQAIEYRRMVLNLNSTYSALFCPDILVADEINEIDLYIPMSGAAAALSARTDRVANPSYSIAGLNRGLLNWILGTRHDYDDAEASELFRNQVNYNRTFYGAGTALWEQQTLDNQTSALSWLSVRRITNVIKVSLYRYSLYYLQEPNTEFTVRGILKSYQAYLNRMVDAQALHSFDLKSDEDNNTPEMDIAGIRNILIVLRPVIPIHELQLDFAITRRGVSVQEISVAIA